MKKKVEELAQEWFDTDGPEYGDFLQVGFIEAKKGLKLFRDLQTIAFMAGYEAALPKWQKLTPENTPSETGQALCKRADGEKLVFHVFNKANKTYKHWQKLEVTHFAEIVWPKVEE